MANSEFAQKESAIVIVQGSEFSVDLSDITHVFSFIRSMVHGRQSDPWHHNGSQSLNLPMFDILTPAATPF